MRARSGSFEETDGEWFIYIIECENGSYYTGYTNDIRRRLREHREAKRGRVAKYTRSFRPARLAGCWRITGTKREAMRIERLIKGMDRSDKCAFVRDPNLLCAIMAKDSCWRSRVTICDPVEDDKE